MIYKGGTLTTSFILYANQYYYSNLIHKNLNYETKIYLNNNTNNDSF